MATTWPETASVTRTPKGCQQWQKNIRQVICGNAKWHAFKKAKPPISSGNPKSGYSDMEVFTDCKRFWVGRLVRDSRSREGKPARDWDKPKEWCCSSASYSSCIIYRKKQNNAGISPGLSGRNGEKEITMYCRSCCIYKFRRFYCLQDQADLLILLCW